MITENRTGQGVEEERKRKVGCIATSSSERTEQNLASSVIS